MQSEEFICINCLSAGSPKPTKRGSKKIEIFCWMLFPIGLPYSIWRMMTKYNACRSCGDGELISIYTELGQELLEEFDKKMASDSYAGFAERIDKKL